MTCGTFTYQTRLAADPAQSAALDAYAALYGTVERTLFARMCAGADRGVLKSSMCAQWGITARQYNAISFGVKGKIDAIKERRVGLLRELKQRIDAAERVLKELAKHPPCDTLDRRRTRRFEIHQKKRRLASLRCRLAAMAADHQAGRVRIAFGSKKLFRAQFDLASNGYCKNDDCAQMAWRADWIAARCSQFMVMGSKDETAGCQGCVATPGVDGSIALRLRLPDSVAEGLASTGIGKHLLLTDIRFAYGHDEIVAAIRSSSSGATAAAEQLRTNLKVARRLTGTAITYRFVRDRKGWRVFVTVAVPTRAMTSSATIGAIGVDINADHLAVSETDRFGNLIRAWKLATPLYGKRSEQRRAIFGDQAVSIGRIASTAGKPVVIERLDFAQKKTVLETVDRRRSRQITALGYAMAASMLKAACFRAGVAVIEVKAAYTSVIGAINFAQRFGISIHQGAAFAIARRGLGLHERPVRRVGIVPTRDGGHVAFDLPARNRSKHVWSFWAASRSRLSAALVEHYRCAGRKPAPPAALATRPLRAHRSSGARFPGASQQHCSADDLGDVPL